MTKKDDKKDAMEMEIDPGIIEEAVKSVEKIVNKTEGKVEEKADETHDRLIRLAADFDNFRKRVQKEKSEVARYGNENLVREILPVLDNFERALEHAQGSQDIGSIRSGVEMIYNQLKTTLERFGVRAESALGQAFDPLVHEAMSHMPSSDYPPHHVMNEHHKAYYLHDRLIRPAMVTVSKEDEENP